MKQRIATRSAAYISFALSLMLMPLAAQAHVRVLPPESALGASETYPVRVPTEGKTATTSVELEVQNDISIVSANDGGVLKKVGDHVVSITWTAQIPPGESREFTFVAKNPAAGQDIMWKARQNFADGTNRYWAGPKGSKEPATVTKLHQ